MTLARCGLLFGAFVLAGLGLGFLVVPVEWASLVEISLPTAMARTDVRATYGGFDLAMGLFVGLCTVRTQWTRPGLVAMGLAAGGFGSGRLVGILVERAASPLTLVLFAVEVSSAMLAFYLLRRLPVPDGAAEYARG